MGQRLLQRGDGMEAWDAGGSVYYSRICQRAQHSYTGISRRTVEGLPLDLYMLEAIAYGSDRSPELIRDCPLLHAGELVRWGYGLESAKTDYQDTLLGARKWFGEVKRQLHQSRFYIERHWPEGNRTG